MLGRVGRGQVPDPRKAEEVLRPFEGDVHESQRPEGKGIAISHSKGVTLMGNQRFGHHPAQQDQDDRLPLTKEDPAAEVRVGQQERVPRHSDSRAVQQEDHDRHL